MKKGGKGAAAEKIAEAVGEGATPKKLIENFGVFVESAGSIEALRTVVLGLAIRGGLLGNAKAPIVAHDWELNGLTEAFSLPSGWEWHRVDEVGEVKLGRQRAPSNHAGPHMRTYLRVANVLEARIDVTDVLQMNFEPAEAERFLLQSGDILLNEGQSYELVGRPAIFRGEVPGACFQNTLLRFRAGSRVVPEFALIVFRAYMRTGRFRKEAQQTTNIAHLSAGRLAGIEFPVPPLAEQKAIVAKVDQLLALCDDVEASQSKKREAAALLTRSVYEAIANATSATDLDNDWLRASGVFAELVRSVDAIQHLRGLIIELAIRGRLVHKAAADVQLPGLQAAMGQVGEHRFGDRGLFALHTEVYRAWCSCYSNCRCCPRQDPYRASSVDR